MLIGDSFPRPFSPQRGTGGEAAPRGRAYFAGYLLEKTLSVDNILVFVLLFASLGVPAQWQRRVLGYGVIGALVLRGVLPVAGDYSSGRFVIRAGGRLAVTPLLVALVAVEVTDLVFALDSIPAVFGVTSDLFIVFTSNAFAVLGLRALFFLLAASVERFVFLTPAIALLLVFIGVKMLIAPVVELPVTASLAVIVAVVAGAVGLSVYRGR